MERQNQKARHGIQIFLFLGRVQTEQSIETQHLVIKAFQHTYITKIPERHTEEHVKIKQNIWQAARLSNMMIV